MPRHENETKAKSFAFVMDRLALINQDVKSGLGSVGLTKDDRKTSIVPCWNWLIPDIRSDGAKRRHFQTSKSPTELAVFVAEGRDRDRTGAIVESILSPYESTEPRDYIDFASLVGSLVRNPDGPIFAALLSGELFDEYFDAKAIDMFVKHISSDFAGRQQFLIDELQASLLSILEGLHRAPDNGNSLPAYWPDGDTATYDRYLTRKMHHGGWKIDWRGDLLTAMLVASLLGPRDYRFDLLIDVKDKRVETRDPNNLSKREEQVTATELVLNQHAHLMRVTFAQNPPDELNWIACEGSSGSTETERDRLMSIPLEGKTEIVMARGVQRFSDESALVEVPLNCPAASSKEHLRINYSAGKWILRDMNSTNGTLVVSRDGTRKLLYIGQEKKDDIVELRNGDVICIAPDWSIGHAIPDHPAFVFQMSTTDWH